MRDVTIGRIVGSAIFDYAPFQEGVAKTTELLDTLGREFTTAFAAIDSMMATFAENTGKSLGIFDDNIDTSIVQMKAMATEAGVMATEVETAFKRIEAAHARVQSLAPIQMQALSSGATTVEQQARYADSRVPPTILRAPSEEQGITAAEARRRGQLETQLLEQQLANERIKGEQLVRSQHSTPDPIAIQKARDTAQETKAAEPLPVGSSARETSAERKARTQSEEDMDRRLTQYQNLEAATKAQIAQDQTTERRLRDFGQTGGIPVSPSSIAAARRQTQILEDQSRATEKSIANLRAAERAGVAGSIPGIPIAATATVDETAQNAALRGINKTKQDIANEAKRQVSQADFRKGWNLASSTTNTLLKAEYDSAAEQMQAFKTDMRNAENAFNSGMTHHGQLFTSSGQLKGYKAGMSTIYDQLPYAPPTPGGPTGVLQGLDPTSTAKSLYGIPKNTSNFIRRNAERYLVSPGRNIMQVSGRGLWMGTLPVVGGLIAGLMYGASVNQAAAYLRTQVPDQNVTTAQIEAMLLQNSAGIPISAANMGTGGYYFQSAGLVGADGKQLGYNQLFGGKNSPFHRLLEFSYGQQIDPKEAVLAISSLAPNFHIPATGAGMDRMLNELAYTVAQSKIDPHDITTNIGRISGIASQRGMSMEQTLGMLTYLSRFMPARQVTSGMEVMLQNMGQKQGTWADLSVRAQQMHFQDWWKLSPYYKVGNKEVARNPLQMLEGLQAFYRYVERTDPSQAAQIESIVSHKLIPSIRGTQVSQFLLGDSQNQVASLTADIGAQGAKTGPDMFYLQQYNTMLDTMSARVQLAKNRIGEMLTTMANMKPIQAIIQGVSDALGRMVGWFNKLTDKDRMELLLKFFAVAAAPVALFAAGAIIENLGILATIGAMLLSPAGIALMAFLGGPLVDAAHQLQAISKDGGGGMMGLVKGFAVLGEQMGWWNKQQAGSMLEKIGFSKKDVSDLSSTHGKLAKDVSGFAGDIKDLVTRLSAALGFIKSIFQFLTDHQTTLKVLGTLWVEALGISVVAMGLEKLHEYKRVLTDTMGVLHGKHNAQMPVLQQMDEGGTVAGAKIGTAIDDAGTRFAAKTEAAIEGASVKAGKNLEKGEIAGGATAGAEEKTAMVAAGATDATEIGAAEVLGGVGGVGGAAKGGGILGFFKGLFGKGGVKDAGIVEGDIAEVGKLGRLAGVFAKLAPMLTVVTKLSIWFTAAQMLMSALPDILQGKWKNVPKDLAKPLWDTGKAIWDATQFIDMKAAAVIGDHIAGPISKIVLDYLRHPEHLKNQAGNLKDWFVSTAKGTVTDAAKIIAHPITDLFHHFFPTPKKETKTQHQIDTVTQQALTNDKLFNTLAKDAAHLGHKLTTSQSSIHSFVTWLATSGSDQAKKAWAKLTAEIDKWHAHPLKVSVDVSTDKHGHKTVSQTTTTKGGYIAFVPSAAEPHLPGPSTKVSTPTRTVDSSGHVLINPSAIPPHVNQKALDKKAQDEQKKESERQWREDSKAWLLYEKHQKELEARKRQAENHYGRGVAQTALAQRAVQINTQGIENTLIKETGGAYRDKEGHWHWQPRVKELSESGKEADEWATKYILSHKSAYNEVAKIAASMGIKLQDNHKSIYAFIERVFLDFTSKHVGQWQALARVLVGHSVVPDMNEEILQSFLQTNQRVLSSQEAFRKSLTAVYSQLAQGLPQNFSEGMVADFKAGFAGTQTLGTSWRAGMGQTFNGMGLDIQKAFHATWISVKNGTDTWASQEGSTFKNIAKNLGGTFHNVATQTAKDLGWMEWSSEKSFKKMISETQTWVTQVSGKIKWLAEYAKTHPIIDTASLSVGLQGGATGGGGINTNALPSAMRQWVPLMTQLATAKGLPPALIAGLMSIESGGDAHALSSKGAAGLLQLEPGTFAQYGPKGGNIWNPKDNLTAGIAFLSYLLHGPAKGNLDIALRMYNAGEHGALSAPGVVKYSEGVQANYHSYIGNTAGAPLPAGERVGGATFGMPSGVSEFAGPTDRSGLHGLPTHGTIFHTDIGEPRFTEVRLPGTSKQSYQLVQFYHNPGWGWTMTFKTATGGFLDIMHMAKVKPLRMNAWYPGGIVIAWSGGVPGSPAQIAAGQADVAPGFSSGQHLHVGYDQKAAQYMYDANPGGFVQGPANSGESGAYSGAGVGGGGQYGPSAAYNPSDAVVSDAGTSTPFDPNDPLASLMLLGKKPATGTSGFTEKDYNTMFAYCKKYIEDSFKHHKGDLKSVRRDVNSLLLEIQYRRKNITGKWTKGEIAAASFILRRWLVMNVPSTKGQSAAQRKAGFQLGETAGKTLEKEHLSTAKTLAGYDSLKEQAENAYIMGTKFEGHYIKSSAELAGIEKGLSEGERGYEGSKDPWYRQPSWMHRISSADWNAAKARIIPMLEAFYKAANYQLRNCIDQIGNAEQALANHQTNTPFAEAWWNRQRTAAGLQIIKEWVRARRQMERQLLPKQARGSYDWVNKQIGRIEANKNLSPAQKVKEIENLALKEEEYKLYGQVMPGLGRVPTSQDITAARYAVKQGVSDVNDPQNKSKWAMKMIGKAKSDHKTWLSKAESRHRYNPPDMVSTIQNRQDWVAELENAGSADPHYLREWRILLSEDMRKWRGLNKKAKTTSGATMAGWVNEGGGVYVYNPWDDPRFMNPSGGAPITPIGAPIATPGTVSGGDGSPLPGGNIKTPGTTITGGGTSSVSPVLPGSSGWSGGATAPGARTGTVTTTTGQTNAILIHLGQLINQMHGGIDVRLHKANIHLEHIDAHLAKLCSQHAAPGWGPLPMPRHGGGSGHGPGQPIPEFKATVNMKIPITLDGKVIHQAEQSRTVHDWHITNKEGFYTE